MKNMKNAAVVSKTSYAYVIIETIVVKNISQIQHTRHRSTTNFLGLLVAGLCLHLATQKTIAQSL